MVSRFLQRWIGLLLGLVALGRVAAASTGSIDLVWQPMATGDYGVVISAVTYLGENNPNPETPVWATVRPNLVPIDARTENVNAAALYGLTLEVRPEMTLFNEQVDTLHVTLRVPADGDTTRREWKSDAREVVPATAQCILFNARSLWPHVRFVDLKIVGSDRWQEMSRVHSLERVRVPERPLQLPRGKLEE